MTKYFIAITLALTLTACQNPEQDYTFDTTLYCSTVHSDGTVTKRDIRFNRMFTATYEPNIDWLFQDGAWVVTDLWYGGRTYMTVTPRPGESCATFE